MHEISAGADSANTVAASEESLLVPLHACVPGRLRIAVNGLRGSRPRARLLEAAVSVFPGVRRVKASSVTGNATIQFARPATFDSILSQLAATLASGAAGSGDPASPGGSRAWHLVSVDEAARALGTSIERGLPSPLARERMRRLGRNRLNPLFQRSPLAIFASQFAGAPVLMLAGAALVSLATGGLLEASAILGIVVMNGILGFTTESRAEQTIRSLSEVPRTRIPVLRDGSLRERSAEDLVPGDVVVVRRGDLVPADARLVSASALSVSEAALTGESFPVTKSPRPLDGVDLSLGQRRNMIYRGTLVTGGDGVAVVVATGARTEVGRVQRLVADSAAPETPIERKLHALGVKLVWLTAAAGLLLFLVGRLRGFALWETARTALAVAVAAVPEGLPMVATTGLAISATRMRSRNVHVRRLEAIETLGSVDVVCFDKTGTLTFNDMSVVALACGDRVSMPGDDGHFAPAIDAAAPDARVRRLFEIACLCREIDAADGPGSGSSTEAALVRAARAHAIDPGAVAQRWPLRIVQHRTESYRFMATSHADDTGEFIAVKGSPLELLARCDAELLADGRTQPLTPERRAEIERANAEMAERALRVLGFAYAQATLGSLAELGGLTWVGLAGLADPIRPGAATLVARLHRAGIHTIMLTGDQAATARAVAQQIGLSSRGTPSILEPRELARMSPAEFALRARQAHGFARVTPAEKLQVVRTLQRAGAVVAMLGDGINDSPALRAANVGISIGTIGEAAAREVADASISDNDPRRLIDAIELGRTTSDNVRKALRFLLGTNTSEVLLTLAMTAAGVSQSLTPLQLLWINLVTDVLPGVGLAYEPPESNLMARPPLRESADLMSPAEMLALGREGSILTAGPLAAGLFGLARHGAGREASTMMFASLIAAQLLHAFSARSPSRTLFTPGRRPANWPLLGIVLGSMLLHLGLPLLPTMRRVLGLAPIGWADAIVTLAAGVLPFLANEASNTVAPPRGATARLEFVRPRDAPAPSPRRGEGNTLLQSGEA